MIARALVLGHDVMTRQRRRADAFAKQWETYRMPPDACGAKDNPVLPRSERRKLARAFATGQARRATA
jgi:hypothetical protein